MATTTLNPDDLYSILQVGSDEYILESPTYGTKWNDETGASTTPDIEDYIQEEEETVTFSTSDYLVDDVGSLAFLLVGGRPKKARRR